MTGLAIYRSIRLDHGLTTWVDQCDYAMLSHWTWYATGGYARAYNGGGSTAKRTAHMHRLIMLPNPGQEIDHINGNRLDNRRRNLRVCTRGENARNQRRAGGSSGYKGVAWKKDHAKWSASIKVSRKTTHLGYFHDDLTAGLAYDTAARDLHGKFARLNFPSEVPL